jgi:hypothetical protein
MRGSIVLGKRKWGRQAEGKENAASGMFVGLRRFDAALVSHRDADCHSLSWQSEKVQTKAASKRRSPKRS